MLSLWQLYDTMHGYCVEFLNENKHTKKWHLVIAKHMQNTMHHVGLKI